MIFFPLQLEEFTHNQGVISGKNEDLENTVAGMSTWQGILFCEDETEMDVLITSHGFLSGVSKKCNQISCIWRRTNRTVITSV